MTKRFRWILVGLIIGLVSGGVAYAVVINPPNSSDRYYACVSPAGVVKSGTLRLNVAPSKCPAATDQVRSWTAVGPTGPSGATGSPGTSGGSELGSYVGRYSATFTATGCASGELRIKIHTLDGQAPATNVGDCSPLRDFFAPDRPPLSPGQTFGVQTAAVWMPQVDTETMFGLSGRSEPIIGTGLGEASDCWALSTSVAVKLATACSSTYDGSTMDLFVNTAMAKGPLALGPSGDMILLGEFLPAGTPVPNISLLQAPDPSMLPQFVVYANP